MQTHRTFLKLTRIEDTMHRLFRVYRAGLRRIHLYRIRSFEPTAAGIDVFLEHAIIFD